MVEWLATFNWRCGWPASLRDFFDELLSVDPVRVSKLHGDAYALAGGVFGLNRRQTLFWSSNALEATGVSVRWVNRGGKVFEEMGQWPDLKLVVCMTRLQC